MALSRQTKIFLIFIGLYLLIFLLAHISTEFPFFSRLKPLSIDTQHYQHPSPPSRDHWLGTDNYGYDVFFLFWQASSWSLFVSFLSLLISASLGVLLGLYSSYFIRLGVWVRLCLEVLDSLPFIFLLMLILSLIKMDTFKLALSMSFLGGWIPFFWHSVDASQRILQKDFILWCQAHHYPVHRIIFVHIFPHIQSYLGRLFFLRLPRLLLILSSLEFLGFSSESSPAQLGRLLRMGHENISAWWLWLPTILFLSIMSLGLSPFRRADHA